MHIKKIIVHVYGYEEIKEYEDKSEKNGMGNLVDPIFLKAEIESEKGEYFAEIDQNYSEVEFSKRDFILKAVNIVVIKILQNRYRF